jgi:hypothetical protein
LRAQVPPFTPSRQAWSGLTSGLIPTVRQISLIAALALSAALLDVGAGPLPANAQAPATVCAPAFSFETDCFVEPARLGIGAHGSMRKIHWNIWGGPVAVGVGRLRVTGFAGQPGTGIGPTKGRVIFTALIPCQSSAGAPLQIYSRITIRYGKHFHKHYVHNELWGSCPTA